MGARAWLTFLPLGWGSTGATFGCCTGPDSSGGWSASGCALLVLASSTWRTWSCLKISLCKKNELRNFKNAFVFSNSIFTYSRQFLPMRNLIKSSIWVWSCARFRKSIYSWDSGAIPYRKSFRVAPDRNPGYTGFFCGYFSSKEFNSFMSTSQHFYDLKFVQNLRYIKYEPFASVFPVFSFEFLVPLKLCGEVAPFYKKFQIETIFIPLSLLVMSC